MEKSTSLFFECGFAGHRAVEENGPRDQRPLHLFSSSVISIFCLFHSLQKGVQCHFSRAPCSGLWSGCGPVQHRHRLLAWTLDLHPDQTSDPSETLTFVTLMTKMLKMMMELQVKQMVDMFASTMQLQAMQKQQDREDRQQGQEDKRLCQEGKQLEREEERCLRQEEKILEREGTQLRLEAKREAERNRHCEEWEQFMLLFERSQAAPQVPQERPPQGMHEKITFQRYEGKSDVLVLSAWMIQFDSYYSVQHKGNNVKCLLAPCIWGARRSLGGRSGGSTTRTKFPVH